MQIALSSWNQIWRLLKLSSRLYAFLHMKLTSWKRKKEISYKFLSYSHISDVRHYKRPCWKPVLNSHNFVSYALLEPNVNSTIA